VLVSCPRKKNVSRPEAANPTDLHHNSQTVVNNDACCLEPAAPWLGSLRNLAKDSGANIKTMQKLSIGLRLLPKFACSLFNQSTLCHRIANDHSQSWLTLDRNGASRVLVA